MRLETFTYFFQNLHHMYRAYGGWTFAFNDYLDLNITAYIDDPRTQMLADIVDPYCEFAFYTLHIHGCQ